LKQFLKALYLILYSEVLTGAYKEFKRAIHLSYTHSEAAGGI
jgi:hypothetical protein